MPVITRSQYKLAIQPAVMEDTMGLVSQFIFDMQDLISKTVIDNLPDYAKLRIVIRVYKLINSDFAEILPFLDKIRANKLILSIYLKLTDLFRIVYETDYRKNIDAPTLKQFYKNATQTKKLLIPMIQQMDERYADTKKLLDAREFVNKETLGLRKVSRNL